MAASKVLYGLIGYGAWGSHHARCIAERADQSRAAAQTTHPQGAVAGF